MKKIKALFLNEFFIVGLIIINALIILIHEFEVSFRTLDYFEAIIAVLFVIEIGMKTSDIRIRK